LGGGEDPPRMHKEGEVTAWPQKRLCPLLNDPGRSIKKIRTGCRDGGEIIALKKVGRERGVGGWYGAGNSSGFQSTRRTAPPIMYFPFTGVEIGKDQR